MKFLIFGAINQVSGFTGYIFKIKKESCSILSILSKIFLAQAGWDMRPLASANASLGVTKSSLSFRPSRDEGEASGGISRNPSTPLALRSG